MTAKATPQHAKHGNAASTTNLRAALPLENLIAEEQDPNNNVEGPTP
jgi:hypothetical protein